MPAPSLSPDRVQDLEPRIYALFAIIASGILLLLISAYMLQIVRGGEYFARSEDNRIRTVAVPSPRGLIYDRNGVLLVNNAPSFNLYAVPGDMRDPAQVARHLSTLIDMPSADIEQRVRTGKDNAYLQVKIKNNLSLQEVARIEAHRLDLSGIRIQVEFKRNAVYDTLAAHLLGYVGEISKTQIESGKFPGVKQGEVIGQYGIEQSLDAAIRGTPGTKRIEVDALGQEKQLLSIDQPHPGDDLFLTLDYKLQAAAEAALGEADGAIVALDPRNGEVLAMVSHPMFNPNDLSVGVSPATWRNLTGDAKRPLINRAISGLYPPGSTYKVVMAATALTTGKTTPAESIHCPGFFPFGGRDFRDWKKGGHGRIALHRALVESCDIYFYRMGTRLPIDTISHYSHAFGLGESTGIDLPGERDGLIPSTEWKRRVRNEPWYPGETLSVAIGQGYVLATPLQMATMLSAVAADGWWHPPRLVKKRRDGQTGEIIEVKAAEGRRVPVSDETLAIIRSALAGVLTEPGGTARSSQSKHVTIAGKTGTAQVLEIKGDIRKKLPKAFDDHAWFVAFAPVSEPTLAVAVLVEHGGHGGSAAAPLAKKVIEAYLAPSAAATPPAPSAL